jgi:hypothetical protein
MIFRGVAGGGARFAVAAGGKMDSFKNVIFCA